MILIIPIYWLLTDQLLNEFKLDVEKQLGLFKTSLEDVAKADVVTLESVKMDLKTELIKLKSLANLVKYHSILNRRREKL